MPLELWTAQFRIPDKDRVDITRAGCYRARAAGKPTPGEFLAPSAGLVFPFLAAFKAVDEVERALPVPRWAEEARAALWARYAAAYRAEMVASYRRRRGEWDALLARERACLVCFCADPDRCHRRLAASFLARCGAIDRGELRAEDAILIGAGEPPAILFGPERPCRKFMFTDGSGGGGIICRSRGRQPRCATCGRPGPLLCDAPVTRKNGKRGTCNARICQRCARTVGDDRHHCPLHQAQEARTAFAAGATSEELKVAMFRAKAAAWLRTAGAAEKARSG